MTLNVAHDMMKVCRGGSTPGPTKRSQMNFQTASDADLIAGFFIAYEDSAVNRSPSALANTSLVILAEELDRRFGTEAGERLLGYRHTVNRVQFARTETGLAVEIAKGIHLCGDGPHAKLQYNGEIGAPGIGQSWRCQCGHYMNRDRKSVV